MNKSWLYLGICAVLLFVGAYIGSPYWAVHNFRAAAQAGDPDQLEAAVDFPVVRESLKSQLTAALMEKFQNDPEMADNPFAGLGVLMVPNIVNSMVDGFVTPDGIARLAQKGKLENGATPSEGATTNAPDFDYEYVELDRFRVKVNSPGSADDALGMLFERRGLFNWKMIRLEIPEAAFRDQAAQ